MFEDIPESFKQLIKTKYKASFLIAITTTLNADGSPKQKIVPNAIDTFNAFRCYDNIKVVLIGQDPYPNKNAHGYAFSSLHSIPPSIKTIYKCMIHHKLIDKIPSHANLSSWADQGVLLLNAALTCAEGKSGSHLPLWEEFTKQVIMDLDRSGIVFILLGDFAIKFGSIINHAKVLTWGHPSPMNSANRDETNPKNFKYANVFSSANEYLTDHNIEPINWNSINS
jgi:uracil-DNA glycosylase